MNPQKNEVVNIVIVKSKGDKTLRRSVSGKALTLNLRTNYTRRLFLSRAYKVGNDESYLNAISNLYDGLMSNTKHEHIVVLDLQIEGKSYMKHIDYKHPNKYTF